MDRVGKHEIDEAVRDKRLRMKLVISTSLGQAWLINHPSCNLAASTHSVFFTESPDGEPLQRPSSAIFCSWYTENLASPHSEATLSCSKELISRDLGELVVSAIMIKTLSLKSLQERCEQESVENHYFLLTNRNVGMVIQSPPLTN
jgi:hypothetical protein